MTQTDPADLRLALQASEHRFHAMMAAALDCVVAMDGDGRVVSFNPAAERTFGYTEAEAVGRDMAELIVPPPLRERHRAGLARHLAGGPPAVLDRRIEIVGMRADGTEFPVELTVTRIAGEGEPLFIGYLRDISDRKAAEAELQASRARLLEAAYEARRRIERDLHDGAQQRLVMLAMTLRLTRERVKADPELTGMLDEAIDELSAATAELRELARGIHPAVLTEGGLRPALRALVSRSAVPVELEAVPDERCIPAVEITAYFVVAEALTNVARYADASSAAVAITMADGALTVAVRDDGRGGADPARGTGLRGLADRLEALGGRLAVDSPPGGGTVLRAEIPCAS
ncbi:MAG TPA: PAS domain S-box protein [Capillimicrobium sp.]